MIDKQQAEDIVDSYLDAVAEGDVDTVLSLFADNATVEDPVGSDVVSGEQGLRAFYSQAIAGKPVTKRTGNVRVAANEAAVPFTVSSSMGGNSFIMEIIDVFKFDEENKIASMRAIWSEANIVAGLSPMP